MIGLATAATYLTLFSTVWAVGALSVGLVRREAGLVQSGRRAMVATWAFVAFEVAVLLYALANNWWHLEYVWRTSLPQQPLIYKIGALWGGMSGSMLFWLLILASCGALLVWKSRHEEDNLSNYALAVVALTSLFFAALVAGLVPGVRNPFVFLPPNVLDEIEAGLRIRGLGLNPLLQTPSMLVHPPLLYGGFVVSTVPFAFAVGGLLAGSGTTQWIVRSRRWTIAAWLFLGLGLLLGGAWAYGELGWGGYWGWDPVENAALLPWLMITAFLHSVMIQEHRNMLKLWNIVLITLTFVLVLFGTTLVRSGVLSSIHAFGQSRELLGYFAAFMLLAVFGVAALIVIRWPQLRSPNRFDSLLSREAAFLFNNWIFVISAVVVFAGTTFPILSEAYYTYFRGIEGRKIAVSEPFYNTFIVPLGLILLFLTGIGPLISWKKATPSNLRRNFVMPALVGAGAGILSLIPFYMVGRATTGGFPVLRTVYAVLFVYASVFVLATVVDEYVKGIRVRLNRGTTNPLRAFIELTRRNKRRYGGYIVHVGIVLFYIGTLGSRGFQISHRFVMEPGETRRIGQYAITIGEPFEERGPNAWYVGSNVQVSKNGRPVSVLRPARGFYDNNDGPSTVEASIMRRLDGDLYIALGEITEQGRVDIQVYYNPLAWVVLILSPLVVLAGGVISLMERGRLYKREEGPA